MGINGLDAWEGGGGWGLELGVKSVPRRGMGGVMGKEEGDGEGDVGWGRVDCPMSAWV